MSEVTEYTREECMPKLISPTGVKYGVFRDSDVDLYEIRAVNEDEEGRTTPNMQRQQPVPGQFTGSAKALSALIKYLTIAWDASDAAKEKLRARKAA